MSKYSKKLSNIANGISLLLGKFGYFIAKRPIIVLVISTVVAISLSSGLLRAQIENDSLKLWVSQKSRPMVWASYLRTHYHELQNGIQVIIKQKGKLEDSNMITLEGTAVMFSIYDNLMSKDPKNESSISAKDVCIQHIVSKECVSLGYLQFWDNKYKAYKNSVGAKTGHWSSGNSQQLLNDINKKKFPDGGDAVTERVFGAVGFENGQISGAQVLNILVLLDPNRGLELTKYYTIFEEKMANVLKDERYKDYEIGYTHTLTLDDAIAQTVTKDIKLVATVPLVVLVLALAVLTQLKLDRSQGTLAIYGIIMVFLGIASGYGICSLIGIKITVLSQVLPFILMGIGVDGVFVLVNSLDEVDRSLPPTQQYDVPMRIQRAVQLGGASLTATAGTDIMAFLFGSFSIIPAVRWFCWQAAITLACTWILQITWFVSLLVLTERRRVQGRFDCLCCFGVDEATTTHRRELEHSKRSFWMRVMQSYGRVLLKNNYTKSTVLLLFFGLMSLGIYGGTQLGEGLKLSDLAPKDHYFQVYERIYTSTFDKDDTKTLHLYFRGLDVAQPENQAKMLIARDIALKNEYINAQATEDKSWLQNLVQFALKKNAKDVITVQGKQVITAGKMEKYFAEFIVQNTRYLGLFDKNFVNNQNITVSAFPLQQTAKRGVKGYDRKSLQSYLDLVDNINEALFNDVENYDTAQNAPAFMYQPEHRVGEQERVIFSSLLMNLGLAILGTFTINLILLVHPFLALLMAVNVLLVDVLLVLEMWLFNIPMNTVSVINLVMAVGLAVDYSVHIAHKFLATPGANAEQRAHKAVSSIGGAVCLGALTTLAGVIPLAFAASAVFVTFFSLLFGTALFGLLVGLAFLPIVLSFVGPKQVIDCTQPTEQVTGDSKMDNVAEQSPPTNKI